MKTLEDLKADRKLIDFIDWDMTPEEAVTLYLEWGNNWSHGRLVKSKNDVSHYFVLNTWDKKPVIFLVKRNSEEASEIASFDVPDEYLDNFSGTKKGVYALDEKIKSWLMEELKAA
ncbi:conserved hypothetical protein [uncultured Desulfobacterium sp.]|uniref:Uncharacterized protein n=1 Tax=uncultured Desulfobacterium sp. TaxID=201089 RepID=A0A445MV17_9BACT|nr:conserved hypothetical protein [uncultured Desulfobacterium sp.]